MGKKSAQVVLIADLHVGSTIGLCNPVVGLDDGGEYHFNSLQKLEYDYWTREFWPYVWANEKKDKRKTIVIGNGDMVDGDHHGTFQTWTRNIDEQENECAKLLEPIAKRASRVYMTRGTPAHVLPSASSDEQVARKIKAQKFTKEPLNTRTHSTFHLSLDVYGVLFNVAHHGPNPGTRMWTYGSTLRSYCKTIVFDAMCQGARPPDVVIRSHVHKRTWETIRDYGHVCECLITPAWQWKTEYAHRVASHEDVAHVGGVIVEIDDGKISKIEFKLLPIRQTDVEVIV